MVISSSFLFKLIIHQSLIQATVRGEERGPREEQDGSGPERIERHHSQEEGGDEEIAGAGGQAEGREGCAGRASGMCLMTFTNI